MQTLRRASKWRGLFDESLISLLEGRIIHNRSNRVNPIYIFLPSPIFALALFAIASIELFVTSQTRLDLQTSDRGICTDPVHRRTSNAGKSSEPFNCEEQKLDLGIVA